MNTYDCGGGAQRAHGDEYHLMLAMLFMLRAYTSDLDFEIAIEFAPAGKFGDIYMRYKSEGAWHQLYFHVKHTSSKESIQLTSADLFPSGNKKPKYNMMELLNSFTRLPHNSHCFMYTNQRWQVPTDLMHEARTRDIDVCFLQHVMYPTCLTLTDTSCLNDSDEADVFISRFQVAHAQRSLSDVKLECKGLMLELAKQNATLATLMLDNLYGQLQDWFNDTTGSFKDRDFVHNFITSLGGNSALYLRYNVRAPDSNVQLSDESLRILASVHDTQAEPGELIDVAVVGEGGSDLVARHLHDHDHMYTHVCWIHAVADDSIQHALQDIALHLGVVNDDDIASEIYASLQHEHKAAFVFYMAQNIDHLVKYLPFQSLNNVHVFVTSPLDEWPARIHVNMQD